MAEATFQQRLEYYGLSAVVWLVGRLPYGALRRLAAVAGSIVYHADKRGRQVARANLDTAFGDKYTPKEKARIAERSYQTFARTMLELFWAPNLSPERFQQLAVVEGLDHPSGHKEIGKPVIYLCLHYSNFEWMSLISAYIVEPGLVITQKFKNPLLGAIFDRLRSSTGHQIFPQERAMIRMLKHLKSGGKFSMLNDLNIDPDEAGVIIETFGGIKLCATQMHAALAMRTGALIMPVECHPMPDGRVRMHIHPPLEYPENATAAEVTQLCWNVLEPSIHAEPHLWLWSYKHWRFKPSQGDTSRYPFYSNTAKRFDKLLRETEKAAKNRAA